jgi:hypothetical protein
MNSSFGFVALLDALGSKTASLKEAELYLQNIRDIKEAVTRTIEVNFDVTPLKSGAMSDVSCRLFGDSVLLTHSISDPDDEFRVFEHLAYVIRRFINVALEKGLLFRGSISLGEFVNEDEIVLGPAISDAAAWYEQLDSVGVLCTPQATMALKSILRKEYAGGDPINGYATWMDVILEVPKLKCGLDLELFVVNWLSVSRHHTRGNGTLDEWFYKIMRSFPIPPGTESKFKNTEEFVLRTLASRHWEFMNRGVLTGPAANPD